LRHSVDESKNIQTSTYTRKTANNKVQQSSPPASQRVLPPGELNGMIPAPLLVYCESLVMTV